jgi:hypothetical protein
VASGKFGHWKIANDVSTGKFSVENKNYLSLEELFAFHSNPSNKLTDKTSNTPVHLTIPATWIPKFTDMVPVIPVASSAKPILSDYAQSPEHLQQSQQNLYLKSISFKK